VFSTLFAVLALALPARKDTSGASPFVESYPLRSEKRQAPFHFAAAGGFGIERGAFLRGS
jgi:hypothetical protein